MLGIKPSFGRWGLLVAIFWATLTGWTRAQDGMFDDDLSGSTSSTTSEDLFGGDSAGGSGQPTQEELQAQYVQLFEDAQRLLADKSWAAALEKFQQLTAMNPNDPRIAVGLGICHAELGSSDLAITALSMAMVTPGAGQVPGLVETAKVYLGRMYLETARYREAQKELADARQSNPNNPDANMLYGKATLRVALTTPSTGGVGAAGQAQLSQAIQSLKQAIDQRNDFGEAYLERGRALLRTRQLEFALEDLQQAVRYMGESSEAAADLGVAYVSRASQEGVKLDPDIDKIVSDLRSAITNMDSYLKTEKLGVRVAPWETVDPLSQTAEDVTLSRVDAKLKLAEEVEASEGNDLYRAAIVEADRVLAVKTIGEEQKARAHFYRGVGMRMQQNLDGAIDAFTEGIQVYAAAGVPYSEAYLRRGICYFHQGKLNLATRDFDSAAANPQNPLGLDPRAMMWSGIALAKQGEYNDAIRSYTRAVKYAPRFTNAFLNRGLAYMNVGRFERAYDDFSTVIRQDPSNSEAASFREMAKQHGQL